MLADPEPDDDAERATVALYEQLRAAEPNHLALSLLEQVPGSPFPPYLHLPTSAPFVTLVGRVGEPDVVPGAVRAALLPWLLGLDDPVVRL